MMSSTLVLVDSISCFCNIPGQMASQIRRFIDRPICIQLGWPYDNQQCVVAWDGTISTSHPNCIEIPFSLSKSLGIENKLKSHMNTVDARVINDVLEAAQVLLTAVSDYDWQLINNFAELVEGCFLNQVVLAYIGQTLVLSVSATVSITLRVLDVVTKQRSRRSHIDEGKLSESVTPYLSVFDSVLATVSTYLPNVFGSNSNESCLPDVDTYAENSIASPQKPLSVAYITTNSMVVVQPFQSQLQQPHPNEEISKSNATSVSASTGFRPEFGISNQLLGKGMWSSPCLRVLPQSFRGRDCCFSDMDSHRHQCICCSSPDVGLRQNSFLRGSDCICVVHPIFFESVEERVLPTPTHYDRSHHTYSADKMFLLERVSESRVGSQPLAALAKSLIVQVRVCPKMRPSRISLSTTIRKALSLSDLDPVRLRLLDDIENRPIRPLQLSLTPIRWEGKDSQAESERLHSHRQDGDLPDEVIWRAFGRALRHRDSLDPLSAQPLCDGAILTLTLPTASNRILNPPLKVSPQTTRHKAEVMDVQVHLLEAADTPRDSKSNVLPAFAILPHEGELLAQCVSEGKVKPVRTVELSAALLACLEGEGEGTDPSGGGVVAMPPPGMADIARAVLSDVTCYLFPAAVLERVKAGVEPAIGLLLIGGSGTGKSALLRATGLFCRNCQRLVTNVITIPCAELKGRAVNDLLKTLSHKFELALLHAPSLLLLDDLDALCPAGGSEGEDPVWDAHAEIVSRHLVSLLHKVAAEARGAHLAAKFLSQAVTGLTTDFADDRVVARALSGAVFVLASSGSDSVRSCLLNPEGFRRSENISRLTAAARISVIQAATTELGSTMEPPALRESEAFGEATEGFVVADLVSVAKTAVASAVRLSLPTDCHETFTPPRPQIKVSWEQLLAVVRGHVCLSSVACESMSSDAATDWSQVGGMEDIRQRLQAVFKLPMLYERLYRNCSARLSRGVLLFGPPGCGKSMIARAAGGDSGLAVLYVRGPQLLDKYIGGSEKAMRTLFGKAKASARPCLIVLDELEAIAPRRGKDNSGVTDRVVNQLLTFLDGVEDTMGRLFVLGVTARPDMVDKALLRPGRIETHVYVGLPDAPQREAVLRQALGSISCHPDTVASLPGIAQQSEGFTCADVRGLAASALLLAVHDRIESASTEQSAFLTSECLWRSLATTKPSLSSKDLQFYDEVNSRFRKSSKGGPAVKGAYETCNFEDKQQRVTLK